MNSRVNVSRLLGAACAALLLSPAAADAQTNGCGSGSGGARATVNIDTPAHGATVSGANVAVAGSASAALVGSINRVEVTFAGVTRVRTYDDSASVRFDVPFDTTSMSPGGHSISVVVCGLLQWGSDRVDVTVEAPRGATTTAVTPTTAVTAPPGTGVVNSSTTVTPTTRAGQPAASTPSSTVGSSTPSTTAAAPVATSTPVAGVTGVSQPARPATARAGDTPLVLTEAPDRGSPPPPLWVGAVVGISGGLGLLFSAATWRRRASTGPEVAEPVDPDLIEVG